MSNLKVQTRVCPVCQTCHDLPLCPERRSEETSASHDAAIMAARTRTALRYATPAAIQREVDRLTGEGLHEVWASMLTMDNAWRSRSNA